MNPHAPHFTIWKPFRSIKYAEGAPQSLQDDLSLCAMAESDFISTFD
jgi:hypothetical protein